MSKQLRLDVAQLTDVGRKRPHNEDNMAYVIPKDEQVMARKGALFIVADGMGGHAAGEVASEIAVETVTITYYQDEKEDILLSLMNAIKRANTIIHQRAAENMLRSGMGTTCVAAVLRGNIAYIANVGDSRAYMVRRGQVRQISQDHSWVEEQVRAGLLTRDQARSHAQRNVITRCLGTQAEVEVDVFSEVLEEGDTLLLCSDGLSGYIAEEDLRSIVAQYAPQESVYHLVERANENSGSDNITAIVMRVQEVGTAEELTTTATRQLVPVGAPGNNEDTMVLGRTPSSSSGASTRSDENHLSGSLARPAATGPLFSSSANPTAPLASSEKAKGRSRRLLYPTLALVIILLVALAGGGAYYTLYWQRDVNHRLDAIADLLSQANAMKDPAAALRELAAAQSNLRDISGSGTVLVGSQSTRATTLQNSLTTEMKQAITNYNQQNDILSLPSSCGVAQSSVINAPSSTTKPAMVAETQDAKQNVFSYVLASEGNNTAGLYTLGAQKNLVKQDAKVFDNSQPMLVTGQGSWLFLVTKSVDQNNPAAGYKLYALQQNSDGTLSVPGDHAPHDLSTEAALSSNKQPQLITASSDDVYVFFYATDLPQQVTILHYNLGNWGNQPETSQLQVSFPLRSVAALPDKQLVLLTSDGNIHRSVFTTGTSTPQQIALQKAIPAPVGVDAQNFRWDASFTAPPDNPTQQLFLNVQGASLLSVGKIADKTYLFVVDDTHHRMIQLDYPLPVAQTPPPASTETATATAPTTGGGAIQQDPPQYVRQLESASMLSAVKSVTTDPKDGHLSLLTLSGGQSTALVSIDTAKAATCLSAS